MTYVPLSRIDLNLLVVLDVLLREQSVGRTAERLNLTPSAVSHALKRLRQLFDNELLVREGRAMVPTARARDLARTLPGLLDQIERTLAPPASFDPATSTRVFRLVAPDFVTPLILRLLKQIGNEAPGIRIDLAPFTPAAVTEMKQGQCDALIAPSRIREDGLRATPIGQWPWTVFGRRDHPGFAEWSRAAWAQYPHLRVRASGPEGKAPVDLKAESLGLERRIGAVVPHFSVAAQALAQTDMLLTVPTVTLGETAALYELDQRPVPFDLPPLELALFRSATTGDEPDVRWFLERVEAVCAGWPSHDRPPSTHSG